MLERHLVRPSVGHPVLDAPAWRESMHLTGVFVLGCAAHVYAMHHAPERESVRVGENVQRLRILDAEARNLRGR